MTKLTLPQWKALASLQPGPQLFSNNSVQMRALVKRGLAEVNHEGIRFTEYRITVAGLNRYQAGFVSRPLNTPNCHKDSPDADWDIAAAVRNARFPELTPTTGPAYKALVLLADELIAKIFDEENAEREGSLSESSPVDRA